MKIYRPSKKAVYLPQLIALVTTTIAAYLVSHYGYLSGIGSKLGIIFPILALISYLLLLKKPALPSPSTVNAPPSLLRATAIIFGIHLLATLFVLSMMQLFLTRFSVLHPLSSQDQLVLLNNIISQTRWLQPWALIGLFATAFLVIHQHLKKPASLRYLLAVWHQRAADSYFFGFACEVYLRITYFFTIALIINVGILMLLSLSCSALNIPVFQGLNFLFLLVFVGALFLYSAPSVTKIKKIFQLKSIAGFLVFFILSFSIILIGINIILSHYHIALTQAHFQVINTLTDSFLIFNWTLWILATPLIASAIARFTRGIAVKNSLLIGALLADVFFTLLLSYNNLGAWILAHSGFSDVIIALTVVLLLLALIKNKDGSLLNIGLMPNDPPIKFWRLQRYIVLQYKYCLFFLAAFLQAGILLLHALTFLLGMPVFIILLLLQISLLLQLLKT